MSFKNVDDFVKNYDIKVGIKEDEMISLEYAVPLIWEYYSTEYKMEFRAGSLGVCRDPKTLELYPHSAYYVFREEKN